MRRIGRRDVLRGAAVLGAGGPLLWRAAPALAASAALGPRWIGFGADPTSQMYVSWSTGTAFGSNPKPVAPQVRWGLTSSYGSTRAADRSGPVPQPAAAPGQPAENTIYNYALLSGLAAGTTYHYAVSNDGKTWSADTTFATAPAGLANFRFTAFGDQAASTTRAAPMMALAASFKPNFHVVPGDLAYATDEGALYPDFTGFDPTQWEKYLSVIGPGGAQSIPWQASVGAHEVEPLGNNGYDGFVNRFPQAYDLTSGSPVVQTYRVGNVAFIHLDGNDLSAQETINNGYTKGAQTAWLTRTLAAYRAAGSAVDFIVVVCNCCPYSTNQNHGSDGGLRDVWGPLFDSYAVDLVITGHVHAYERTHPMRAGQPTRKVAPGGTVNPASDGTTYLCAGGGGNGLYPTWYGTTGAGDAGSATLPKVWRYSGGDTASGGVGKPQDITDTAKNFSACRRAVWHCLVVTVTAPTTTNPQTSMKVQAVMPTQNSSAVTSTVNPTVFDTVTLVRQSTNPAIATGTAH